MGRGNARPGREHALQRASWHGLYDQPQRLREYRAEFRCPPTGSQNPVAFEGNVRLGRDGRTGYARTRSAPVARGHRPVAGNVSGLAEEPWPRKSPVEIGGAGTGPAETA